MLYQNYCAGARTLHVHMFMADLVLGRNLCYIAVGIAMEGDRVLLIQESFDQCRGQWYLPAGKVDTNETIVVSHSSSYVCV